MKKAVLILMLGYSVYAASIELPDNFKADFTQTVTNTKKKVLNYNGNILFSDSSLKWSYIKPTKKEVCTNGKNLTVVDHDLEQVAYYRITKGLDFAMILKSAKLHKKNIYLANYENKNYTIKVDKKQKLHSIAYFDDLDNKVQILFKDVIYGKGKITQKDMNCSIPKSYDIIKG